MKYQDHFYIHYGTALLRIFHSDKFQSVNNSDTFDTTYCIVHNSGRGYYDFARQKIPQNLL